MTVVGKNIPHDLDQERAVPGVAGLFTHEDLHHNLVPIVRDVPRTESFLAGTPITLGTFEEAGRVARSEAKPIFDVRGGADYRAQQVLVPHVRKLTCPEKSRCF